MIYCWQILLIRFETTRQIDRICDKRLFLLMLEVALWILTPQEAQEYSCNIIYICSIYIYTSIHLCPDDIYLWRLTPRKKAEHPSKTAVPFLCSDFSFSGWPFCVGKFLQNPGILGDLMGCVGKDVGFVEWFPSFLPHPLNHSWDEGCTKLWKLPKIQMKCIEWLIRVCQRFGQSLEQNSITGQLAE